MFQNYSEGLYTEHWNTEHIGIPKVWISNDLVLEWSVKEIAIAMVPTILKPNLWKLEQNGSHFVPISNGF